MHREEYRSLLGRLPIKNPTPWEMAEMCPHLTARDAVEAFTIGSGFVACPPLFVRHGYCVLHYRREWVEQIWAYGVVTGTKNHPPYLEWGFARRTKASYADGKPHGDTFTRSKYMSEAMEFAVNNWGSDLILDDWEDVVEIYIQDPTDLVNDCYHRDYPRTKTVLFVALSRDFNNIINYHTKPESELFDDAISQMTLDRIIWDELKGGRAAHTKFNCAHCGSGLWLSSCTGCNHEFGDDHIRSGWYTPLSRKMVAFLRENGHVLKIDPEIAWAEERQKWEANMAYQKKRHNV